MIIVLGATGHIGSAVAVSLLARGEAVTAVTRSAEKAEGWRGRGAQAAVVDVGDAEALRAVLRRGRRAFLLNPPAPPSADTDAEEHRTGASIVSALEDSGLEAVVALSAYGAQPSEAIGDLGTLHAFEEALRAQPIPATILRAAYLMSNWDALLPAAREGKLPTMLPPDMKLPMVAPVDLGHAAARLLMEPADRTGTVRSAEGPERSSSGDVAAAFADALGRPVEVDLIPREAWEPSFRNLGFSAPAARSYARMTAISVDGAFDRPDHPQRGTVTLADYIGRLVANDRAFAKR